MKQDARQMMAAGRQPMELDIEHVRQPRQWMPETHVAVAECPPHALSGETRLHVGIVGHVDPVVDVDEVEARGGPVEEGEADEEKGTDQQR
jgi:hypothetical protein